MIRLLGCAARSGLSRCIARINPGATLLVGRARDGQLGLGVIR